MAQERIVNKQDADRIFGFTKAQWNTYAQQIGLPVGWTIRLSPQETGTGVMAYDPEDPHVPLRKWLVAWYLLCSSKKGYSALQLQRALELGSYRTAWFMLHRIRYALRDPSFSDPLGGTVEADETYIGGTVHGRRQG